MPVSQQLSAFDYGVPPYANLPIKNIRAAYLVQPSDNGYIISCNGTFTVSLPPAFTLGSGFNCWVWNNGTGAVTISRSGSDRISGRTTVLLRGDQGIQIVCDGTTFIAGDAKATFGYAQNISQGATTTASGTDSFAIGYSASATGAYSFALGPFSTSASATYSMAIGDSALASGQNSTAVGYQATSGGTYSLALGGGTSAASNHSAAIGRNASAQSSQAANSGAMALGGSYASGNNSFAAAVANNTSTYGATGANSVAIGDSAKATATSAFALGTLAVADATDSMAFGDNAVTNGIIGKYAFGSGNSSYVSSFLLLRNQTTDATPTTLTSQAAAASTTSQLVLPNNSAYAFTGTIVARQQASGGTASAAWKVEGLIRREANAASTTLVASTVTAIDNTPGWTLALSADTTNGGLKVETTGAASTNIRWVATIYTSEVTYA